MTAHPNTGREARTAVNAPYEVLNDPGQCYEFWGSWGWDILSGMGWRWRWCARVPLGFLSHRHLLTHSSPVLWTSVVPLGWMHELYSHVTDAFLSLKRCSCSLFKFPGRVCFSRFLHSLFRPGPHSWSLTNCPPRQWR
jgi:hypothetical protein